MYLLYYDSYYGNENSIEEFDTIDEVMVKMESRDIEDYTLYEATQLPLAELFEDFNAKKEDKIRTALLKLTHEDKVILGLVKA